MKNVILKGPGIIVVMNPDEVFPHDPGQGTPVLVEFDNNDSGTWNCVTSENETANGTRLNDEQREWINSDRIVAAVSKWMKEHNV